MRPIRLELRGFTAFRERTVVEFEGRQLFAITGPTGAGKSSLLDAMTWALFGQVPRVGSSTRQLISHGATSMQVRFDFATRDSTYRVVRKAPAVTGTRLEQLQADGNWRHLADRSRDVTREVTRLLGMDFTTFTRTVLLPQGEFDAFLKGEHSERRAILTKLLGLGVYDDARKIANDRAKQARGRSETVEAQLAKLNLASPERIAELEVAHATAQQRLAELNDRREALRGLGDLARAAREAATTAATAATTETAAREAQAVAEQVMVAVSEAVAQAERECDALSRERTQLQYDPKQHQTLLAQIERIALREAAERELIEAQRGLETAQAERKAAEQAATAANRAVAEAEVTQASAVAAQQQATTQLAAVLGAAKLELASLEGRASEAATAAQAATRDRLNLNGRLPRLEAASKLLEQRGAARTSAAQAASEADATEVAAAQQAAAAETELEAATARFSEARAALEQARHADLAATIRGGLKLGDACPVCGEPITQLPMSLDESGLTAAEAAVQEAERLIEGARRQATHARTAAAAAHARAESASVTLASTIELLGAVDLELAELKTTAVALPEALVECREAYQQVEERERTATQSATATTAELESLRVALAGVPPEVEPASADVPCGDLAAISETIEAWRTARDASARTDRQVQTATAERSKFEQTIAASTARSEAAEQHLDRSRARLAEHGDAPAAAESSALREALEVAERASKRAAELDGLISTARATIAARIATRTAAETERTRAVEAAATGATAAVAARATAEHEQQTFVTAWHQSIEDDVTPSFEALRDLMRAHEADQQAAAIQAGVLGEQIAQAKRETLDAERMQGEVAADRAIAELHSALAKELQGDRFVGYIQREAMQLLAADASYRLDGFTGGRYELASDENEFVVVDRLNGDERRSVKTLSGGETFLASLALALSLSEHLPQLAGLGGAVSLESLFLDEGFGALDADSLDLAVQGLETLAGGHRMIGVISHVEEMAERLPERIEVVKNGNASTIRG